nr:acetate--CoA ligase family protein [Blastococcus saxobsidens]
MEAARRSGSRVLPELLAKHLLRERGVPTPRGTAVVSPEEGRTAVGWLTAPYVLKVISPTVVHKSDLGGVRVGLADADEVAGEITAMEQRLQEAGHDVDGFLIEELAPAGQEIVVGAVREPGLGFVLMLGLGGVFVEVLRDVTFRLCPITRGDVVEMLGELRGRSLLDGVRGAPAADVDALVDVVVAIGGADGLLANLPPDVVEVDLNPVIVAPRGAAVVDARLVISRDPAPEAAVHRAPEPTDFCALLTPKTVAVVGASARGTTPANLYIRNLRAFGYHGDIYPVHPTADLIEGLPASRSLGETPTPVDYAYVAVAAASVPGTLAAADGRVRFAQVISSGFGETPEGADLERQLVAAAEQAGVRLLGPNCLGTHSPHGRVTFVDRSPSEPGSVGVISQSGGLSVDILRLGQERGLRFSGVVSLGNGADVSPAELLTHFLDDPATGVVALYLESLAEGRRVLDVLRSRPVDKPVVLLAGGRTASGARAALSHTGALAGNHLLWPALARQAGLVLVDTLSQLVDALLAFQQEALGTRSTGTDVVLFGNGGGTSVLATDALERVGLQVPNLPEETVAALRALGLPPGTSLVNPLDAPAWTLAVDDGQVAERILSAVLDTSSPAAVISHLNVGIIMSNTATAESDVMAGLIDSIARARDRSRHQSHHLLVLRSDGNPAVERHVQAYRERALQSGLPVFGELVDAASAAAALLLHERVQARRAQR